MPQLIITLKVNYELNGVPLSELAAFVERNVRHMIGDGGLTGESAAEVDTWFLETATKAESHG